MMTECVSCKQTRPIAARGLCRTCYSRWQRTGEFTYKETTRGACRVEGCPNKVHGQGLCSKHLLRLRRTGTTEPGRTYPQKNGLQSQHDLYAQWTEFRRAKNKRPVVQEWLDDMDTFVRDVGGARPSRRHRLYPVDRSRPVGPDNYIWREASIEKMPGEGQKEYAKRQRLAHREMYPDIYKDQNLKRSFGPDFGIDQYIEMLEAQDHKCAICGEKETAVKNNKFLHLAVDHCHRTKKVRQLLCQACNTGLGKFRDDTSLLALAIAYLAKHNQPA